MIKLVSPIFWVTKLPSVVTRPAAALFSRRAWSCWISPEKFVDIICEYLDNNGLLSLRATHSYLEISVTRSMLNSSLIYEKVSDVQVTLKNGSRKRISWQNENNYRHSLPLVNRVRIPANHSGECGWILRKILQFKPQQKFHIIIFDGIHTADHSFMDFIHMVNTCPLDFTIDLSIFLDNGNVEFLFGETINEVNVFLQSRNGLNPRFKTYDNCRGGLYVKTYTLYPIFKKLLLVANIYVILGH